MGLDLMTIKDVCREAKVSKYPVYKWLRTRKLKGHKVGDQWRILRKDFEAFVLGNQDNKEL